MKFHRGDLTQSSWRQLLAFCSGSVPLVRQMLEEAVGDNHEARTIADNAEFKQMFPRAPAIKISPAVAQLTAEEARDEFERMTGVRPKVRP